jgi:tetratricopeptide (TPR) repeat protein
MNNRAVALIRVGTIKEGLDLYSRTLEAIAPDQIEIRAIVQYNLGLGYARANQLQNAINCLQEAEKCDKKKMVAKAKNLRLRVIKAMTQGRTLEIRSASEVQPVADQKIEAVLAKVDPNGEAKADVRNASHGLEAIYTSTVQVEKAKAILALKLYFKEREKIVKGETKDQTAS